MNIISKIKDSNKWPAFRRPEFLKQLNEIADEAFRKKSTEGYLASLLIYHQLCEEMIKVLLDCCVFFVRCRIFPKEIGHKKTDKKMFGQLIDELDKAISFNKKEKFLSKCKELNNVRIRMVHKLTKKSSLRDIEEQTSKVKKIFDEIYKLFDEIYDNFRLDFHSLQKDFIDD